MKHNRSLPSYGGGDHRPLIATPKRVCLLIGQLGLGGAEKQVVLLARGLSERGVRTSVLVMYTGGPREDELRAAGVRVVHLDCPSLSSMPHPVSRSGTGLARAVRAPGLALRSVGAAALAAESVRRIAVHLRRERPDVLHAFLFHGYAAAGPAALLARVPVLVAGRRGLSGREWERPGLRVLARIANRLTDHVVANADAVADCARNVERIPAAKLATIYNGIPDSAFEPAAAAVLDTDAPVILCVANLYWYKGHRHLIEAAALLRERAAACTLALVGDGPERRHLEDRARELALDVRFLGHRADVEMLLARADVCVLPSLTEGMSNAVMEAMAAGKPVVATEVGGTGELLRGRGVLVPPGDPEALADGLARVLGDPVLAARLGAEARRWSRAHLSADAMVERHVDLYGKLLAARCAG